MSARLSTISSKIAKTGSAVGLVFRCEYLLTGRSWLVFAASGEDLRHDFVSQRDGVNSVISIGGRYLANGRLNVSYGAKFERSLSGLTCNRYKGLGGYSSAEPVSR